MIDSGIPLRQVHYANLTDSDADILSAIFEKDDLRNLVFYYQNYKRLFYNNRKYKDIQYKMLCAFKNCVPYLIDNKCSIDKCRGMEISIKLDNFDMFRFYANICGGIASCFNLLIKLKRSKMICYSLDNFEYNEENFYPIIKIIVQNEDYLFLKEILDQYKPTWNSLKRAVDLARRMNATNVISVFDEYHKQILT